MGIFIANKVIKLMIKKGHKIQGSRALILGVTFKENCPDIRNSRVTDIYNELCQFGLNVEVYDPHANKIEVFKEYNIRLTDILKGKYDAIVLAVSHSEFLDLDFEKIKKNHKTVIFDSKAVLNRLLVDGRL
jgi:UDP-N-acetyl-D-galactosamine dehydrogenase